MTSKIYIIFVVKCILFDNGDAAVPATFFWKPRLGIDLSMPSDRGSAIMISKDSVHAGDVVLVDAYEIGITMVALANGIGDMDLFPHLHPMSAYYHTNAYRWALRHMGLLPRWTRGNAHYVDLQKTWPRRFYAMNTFMPKFMRHIFPYVDGEEWDEEEADMAKFKKYAERTFSKHYRYPSSIFRNFQSFESQESIDNLDESSVSERLPPRML